MRRMLRADLDRLRGRPTPGAPHSLINTALEDVKLFWSEAPLPRTPLSYDPGVVVLVAGRKLGYLGDRHFAYAPNTCLAIGLPIYFECASDASPEEPLIGLYMRANPSLLRVLAVETGQADAGDAAPIRGVQPIVFSSAMRSAVGRLVTQLTKPSEAQVLAANTLREFFFHVLQTAGGRALLLQSSIDRPEARIAQLIRDVLDNGAGRVDVADMAASIGMGRATFYRHFQAATGHAPKAYFRNIRLMRAKTMLTFENVSVAEAAYANGYASASQFSRAFRAFFGEPPTDARDASARRAASRTA